VLEPGNTAKATLLTHRQNQNQQNKVDRTSTAINLECHVFRFIHHRKNTLNFERIFRNFSV
jgi:hypothetical protein